MHLGELISSLLSNLQSLCRSNIILENASFQQIIGLLSIGFEGTEMSNLSLRLGIDNSTATRLIIGLEKKNWVIRKKSQSDNRVVVVFLTEEGKSAQKEIEKQFDDLGEKIKSQMPIDESVSTFNSLAILNWTLMKIKMETDNVVLCK
tara:strand:- start:57 stop:500 length:444 start_codon:yes stop_codon:yes gene_type:complete